MKIHSNYYQIHIIFEVHSTFLIQQQRVKLEENVSQDEMRLPRGTFRNKSTVLWGNIELPGNKFMDWRPSRDKRDGSQIHGSISVNPSVSSDEFLRSPEPIPQSGKPLATSTVSWNTIILKNCHKTVLFDLPLRLLNAIKYAWIKGFFMVIAPSGKTWVFPCFLGFHPQVTSAVAITTEQEIFFATESSPDFTGSTITDQSTSLDWFTDFRTVNISLSGLHPSIIHLLTYIYAPA